MAQQKKKGISPLIASVLLIAFTLSIGAFLSTWLQDITKRQTTETIENSKPECQFAALNIQSAIFSNGTTPKKLRIDVENTGTKGVNINQIKIIYGDDTNTYAVFNRTAINAGDAYTLVMDNSTTNGSLRDDIRKFRLVTDCPNNNLEYEGDYILIE